ncbi:hypothetical protein CB1_000245033 [Camelus ferus]|nr:hypothetical protein CB1_000245033 [Camelus ferus]
MKTKQGLPAVVSREEPKSCKCKETSTLLGNKFPQTAAPISAPMQYLWKRATWDPGTVELVKPLAAHSSLGAPLTDDQKLLLEGGPPSERLHWCMPLPCVAMIHFADYQSFLQLCLLTFDQRFPFNTRKICLEREREKARDGEINGSRVSGGPGFMARGASA